MEGKGRSGKDIYNYIYIYIYIERESEIHSYIYIYNLAVGLHKMDTD